MRKKAKNIPADMISELPASMIESILTHLSTRDAVRTSILSKNWRYKWTYLPTLEFSNYTLLSRSTKDLLYTIVKVLVQKRAPTLCFYLIIASVESCEGELDLVLAYLSRNNIKKLTLLFWDGMPYKLPGSIFSCLSLTCLSVGNCSFRPPSTFEGFTHLTSLSLSKSHLDSKTFGNFVSSCPVLERLTLSNCICPSAPLEVSAPNLKRFCFRGNFDLVCLKNVPLLSKVVLNQRSEVEIMEKGKVSSLTKFFTSLPAFEDLKISATYIKNYIGDDSIPEKLPTCLVGLRKLHVEISHGTVDGVQLVLYLLRSAPSLQTLIIQSNSSVSDPCMIPEERGVLSLKQLRKVVLDNVSGTPAELTLINLLLAASPILEKVRIKPESPGDNEDALVQLRRGFDILKSVVTLKRASPKAEIIFL